MSKKTRKGDENITEADIDAKIREHKRKIARHPVAWTAGLGNSGDFWEDTQRYFEEPDLQALCRVGAIHSPECLRFLIALADTLQAAADHEFRHWTKADDELAVIALLLLSPRTEAFDLGLEHFEAWEREQAAREATDLRRLADAWIRLERGLPVLRGVQS